MSLKTTFERSYQFILSHQWASDLTDLNHYHKQGIRWLRTLTLAVYEFMRNKCILRAASLTLVFIFSLAPALALGFSVAKGFGAQQYVRPVIYRQLSILGADEDSGIRDIVDTILDYVEKTNVQALGLVGLLVILYTAYAVLDSIESTMNDIWGVRRRRGLLRRGVDYLAVLFVLPLMLMITALVAAAVRAGPVMEQLQVFLPRGIIQVLGGLVAFSSAFLGFCFLYYFFPNTRVPVKSAVVGALGSAVLWALLGYAYVRLQIGVAKYNAIYGTFAAIPIFLLWLQCSWFVVLFGAEMSYAHANMDEFEFGGLVFTPSPVFREQLGLGVMAIVSKAFAGELPPPSIKEISRGLAAPVRVVRGVVADLISAHLLTEIQLEDQPHYQPAVPLDQITVERVLQAISDHGEKPAHSLSALKRLGVLGAIDAQHRASEKFRNSNILEFVRYGEADAKQARPASSPGTR